MDELVLESFKLNSRVKVNVLVGYEPTEDDEEKKIFWNICKNRVGIGFRLCILGYLNGWTGDGVRPDITGAFGVPAEWWNSVLKGVCVLVTGVCLSRQGWQGVKMEWR